MSVPPSQRSLTKGMPQRSDSRSIVSPACRFVPTNSTRLPAGGDLLEILLGPQQAANGLADVDDVDQVLAGVDVGPHFGVPAAGPMAEMDPRFDQLLHQDRCHRKLLAQGTPASARGGGWGGWGKLWSDEFPSPSLEPSRGRNTKFIRLTLASQLPYHPPDRVMAGEGPFRRRKIPRCQPRFRASARRLIAERRELVDTLTVFASGSRPVYRFRSPARRNPTAQVSKR